jgi:hypothetical protein
MDIKDIKCDHCGEGVEHDVLVMHGRCHMGSPTYEVLLGDKLTIYCATCDKKIVAFRVEGTETELDPKCHPEAETWVMLHKQENAIVQCALCDVEIAKFKVLGLWRD